MSSARFQEEKFYHHVPLAKWLSCVPIHSAFHITASFDERDVCGPIRPTPDVIVIVQMVVVLLLLLPAPFVILDRLLTQIVFVVCDVMRKSCLSDVLACQSGCGACRVILVSQPALMSATFDVLLR